MIVVSFIEELLPLAQLSVELRAPLCKEIQALLLEFVDGRLVDFVHNFDVVYDSHFLHDPLHAGHILAMRIALVPRQAALPVVEVFLLVLVLRLILVPLCGYFLAIQFSLGRTRSQVIFDLNLIRDQFCCSSHDVLTACVLARIVAANCIAYRC